MKVSAKTKAKPTPVTVDYDIPADLAGLQKRFGDVVVAAHASGSIIISAQAFMRRLIEKGSNPQQIQAEIAKWKPDVRTASKQSAFEKAANSVDKLSPDERLALLKKLQVQKAA